MRYLRLGEIPKNERSINWFKVSLDNQADFSWELENGFGYESAIRNIENYDEVLEDGVSVFEIDENDAPIFRNDNLKNTYEDKMARNCAAYIVEGDMVAYGCDGEPLIRNVRIIKEIYN